MLTSPSFTILRESKDGNEKSSQYFSVWFQNPKLPLIEQGEKRLYDGTVVCSFSSEVGY
jgi:hypothetical protein